MPALEFGEVPEFTRDLHRIAEDRDLWVLQNELIRNPAKGAVIRGTGGLRKVRMKLPGRGKSGGARVIYLHLPRLEKIMFLFIYTKGSQADLSTDQRKQLQALAKMIEEGYAKKRN